MASCSNVFPAVFQPHKHGKPLRSSAKVIVLNVYLKLREQNPSMLDSGVIDLCADLTGVSARSIKRIKAEIKNTGQLLTPGKKRPLKVNTQRRNVIYDDFTKMALRKKVHSFFFRNEIPTIRKVMLSINEDEELPNLSHSTVRRLMIDLGFVYETRDRRSMLIEREDIQHWRRKYLREISQYRAEGRKIYYTDETWVNLGHTKEKVWKDATIMSHKQAFLSGLSSGLKAPSGKGQRIIVIHAGSEDGFVKESEEIFKAQKNTGDYHGEMNGEHYEEWFVKKFLPYIQPRSVIVLDNASYHTVRVEPIPSSASKKADIQAWLTGKNIQWLPDMLKTELLKLVAENKKPYERYRIDEIAAEHGHKILRLPPYHCELNPIELVWSQVKGYVAAENKTYKMPDVLRLTKEGIDKVTASSWSNCVQHVIKEEKKMWELDGLAETIVENVQFTVGDTSDESESESDEDDNLNSTSSAKKALFRAEKSPFQG